MTVKFKTEDLSASYPYLDEDSFERAMNCAKGVAVVLERKELKQRKSVDRHRSLQHNKRKYLVQRTLVR